VAISTERGQKALARYAEAYTSLFHRPPSELRDLGSHWVLVNGARMSIEELEQITTQMRLELQQQRARKRNLLQRLVNWLSS
jgi:hypothetical protein